MERHSAFVKIINEALGDVKLQQLTPRGIQVVYTAWGERYAPRTVGGLHSTLHQALDQAVVEGVIPRNPPTGLTKPEVKGTTARALGKEEIGQLLSTTRGGPLYGPIITSLLTGMRRGEVCGLRWQDVGDTTISVRNQLNQPTGRVESGPLKTESALRNIEYNGTLAAVFSAQRKYQAENKLRHGRAYQDTGYVFTSEIGRPWSPKSLSEAFYRLMKTLKWEGVHFHTLRHTFVTHALVGGHAPTRVVQDMAGHSGPEITQGIYTHSLKDAQREVAEYMGAFVAECEKEVAR
jgi:integrase